ncbi:DUF3857 domain-containing transglutaminase family protein [Shewanella sp. AS16]|uniref:DUF3857 domain-containing transglutaminase family protein n=1 Tax=Shewanella sp. AS16 TaxID=2907625 RepID=UPI001F44E4B6|nr:DUF3857 domain-containing transglutaminase family protein [Shewanella sp. AS16]MCE9687135.1 DUF3857 domain-containing transglutaminase family protein [Shewanella sp. AS16]
MKTFNFLALCCLLLGGQAQAKTINSGDYSIELAPAPNWVKPTTMPPAPGQLERSPSHYRLLDRQIRIEADSSSFFQGFAAIALNQEGVKQLSKLELSFNPAFETLVLHSLEVQRNGKWSDRLAGAKINIINEEPELSNDLFQGMATAVVISHDVRIGDTLSYSFSIQGRNPVYGKEFSSGISMGWTEGVDSLSMRLVNSSGRKLYLDPKQMAPAVQSHDRFGDEYLWQQSAVPKYLWEQGAPQSYTWAPTLYYSSAANWGDVVNWALPLYRFDQPDSPELAAFVREVKQHTGKSEQLAEIIRFVQQDIRYYGVEIGQNSHQPHSPNEVFNHRYGDCKDKATLMVHLLAEIGVESYPALVNSRIGDALPERIPAAIAFDHVINLVRFDGQDYWVDGTNNSQAKGLQQLSQADFGNALVLRPGNQALSPMPQASAEADRISVDMHYVSANYDAPVDLYVTTRFAGRQAEDMRFQLAGASDWEVEKHYLNYYAKFYHDINQAESILIRDNNDSGEGMLIREHYRIGDFWKSTGHGLDFSLFATNIKSYVELPEIINRSQPLLSRGPIKVEQTVRLTFPEHINFLLSGEDSKIETQDISYRSSGSYSQGQLIRHHELTLPSRVVAAERSRDFIETLRKIDNDLYYNGSLSGDFSKPVNPGLSYLEQVRKEADQ